MLISAWAADEGGRLLCSRVLATWIRGLATETGGGTAKGRWLAERNWLSGAARLPWLSRLPGLTLLPRLPELSGFVFGWIVDEFPLFVVGPLGVDHDAFGVDGGRDARNSRA
jgi:hypothetical protein